MTGSFIGSLQYYNHCLLIDEGVFTKFGLLNVFVDAFAIVVQQVNIYLNMLYRMAKKASFAEMNALLDLYCTLFDISTLKWPRT